MPSGPRSTRRRKMSKRVSCARAPRAAMMLVFVMTPYIWKYYDPSTHSPLGVVFRKNILPRLETRGILPILGRRRPKGPMDHECAVELVEDSWNSRKLCLAFASSKRPGERLRDTRRCT